MHCNFYYNFIRNKLMHLKMNPKKLRAYLREIRLRLLCNMEYDQDGSELPLKRQNNTLPIYGNKETMNLNSMLLTNIRASPYFKMDLFELKTFHEVVDEIYYKVR